MSKTTDKEIKFIKGKVCETCGEVIKKGENVVHTYGDKNYNHLNCLIEKAIK